MSQHTASEPNDAAATLDLDNPEYYTDWRLSQLEFNQRVLAQTVDTFNPLLERLKFLCIFSTNMDEFFEVRVASLKEEAVHTTARKSASCGKSRRARVSAWNTSQSRAGLSTVICSRRASSQGGAG